MLITILAVGGAALVGIGTVVSVVGGIMSNKQQEETQRQLIDYELEKLGRRDSNNQK